MSYIGTRFACCGLSKMRSLRAVGCERGRIAANPDLKPFESLKAAVLPVADGDTANRLHFFHVQPKPWIALADGVDARASPEIAVGVAVDCPPGFSTDR